MPATKKSKHSYRKPKRLDLHEQLVKRDFSRIPNPMLRRLGEVDERLRPIHRQVLQQLFSAFNWKHETCAFPSASALAEWTGYSDRAIKDALQELREWGLVTTTPHGRGYNYDLSPLLEELLALGAETTAAGDDKPATNASADAPPASPVSDVEDAQSTPKKKKKDEGVTSTQEFMYEEFWPALKELRTGGVAVPDDRIRDLQQSFEYIVNDGWSLEGLRKKLTADVTELRTNYGADALKAKAEAEERARLASLQAREDAEKLREDERRRAEQAGRDAHRARLQALSDYRAENDARGLGAVHEEALDENRQADEAAAEQERERLRELEEARAEKRRHAWTEARVEELWPRFAEEERAKEIAEAAGGIPIIFEHRLEVHARARANEQAAAELEADPDLANSLQPEPGEGAAATAVDVASASEAPSHGQSASPAPAPSDKPVGPESPGPGRFWAQICSSPSTDVDFLKKYGFGGGNPI